MGEEPDDGRRPSRREQQDELLIAALVAGASYVGAGRTAGDVSERTVRRRMGSRQFAAKVSRRRGERVAAVAGRLVGAAEAIEVLTGCLRSENGTVRMKAAGLLPSLGNQMRHSAELEKRLAALESAADGGERGEQP